MNPTSLSLLDRLREASPGDDDWLRLQGIYFPLIRKWLARIPELGHEVDDLAQDVFAVVAREIPGFRRQREGSFRAWLRQVTVNQVRAHRKRRQRWPSVRLDATEGFLDRLADPQGDLAREWDADHDRHVFSKLVSIVQPDFGETTWEAFRRFAIEERPAADVARELGLSVNAVIQAKSRVLKRLRMEARGVLG